VGKIDFSPPGKSRTAAFCKKYIGAFATSMAASHKTPTKEPLTYDKIYESLCFARKYVSHILLHSVRQKFGPFSGIRPSVLEIAMQEGSSFKVVKHLLLSPDDATRQCGTVDRVPGPLDFVIFILRPASNLF
jgi:hypothetical protein